MAVRWGRVNGLSGEFKEYQQRSRRGLSQLGTQAQRSLGENAPAIKSASEGCRGADSLIDRVFFIEVFLIAAAQKFYRVVHHAQAPAKFSSNICFTKGVLCPEKSIRSIKNSTVR